MSRPCLPTFTTERTAEKARIAEDAGNGHDPARVWLAYTEDIRCRNCAEFVTGHVEIVAFLNRKWMRERHYRLVKELWAFHRRRGTAAPADPQHQ